MSSRIYHSRSQASPPTLTLALAAATETQDVKPTTAAKADTMLANTKIIAAMLSFACRPICLSRSVVNEGLPNPSTYQGRYAAHQTLPGTS